MPGLGGLGNCILYSYLFTDYFLKNEVVGKRFVELIKGGVFRRPYFIQN